MTSIFFGSGYERYAESDVAIVICTYNPIWKKLKETLDSCIIQHGLVVQIIVSDDGSKDNCFDKIVCYLDKKNFANYALVPAQENQGTVKNFLKGVKTSTAKYIKPLSPGDYLYDKNVLRDWISYLKQQKKSWSFGDAIYYRPQKSGNQVNIVQRAHPQDIKPYLAKDWSKCRWNYVVLSDIAVGVALIGTKKIYFQYLSRIDGKVKFAEDNIFRMMMFDGVVGVYYSQNVVFYEYGEGVSTSNSTIWNARLHQDWEISTRIMLANIKKDDLLQQKMIEAYNAKMINNIFFKFLSMPKKWELLKHKFFLLFMPRKTKLPDNNKMMIL